MAWDDFSLYGGDGGSDLSSMGGFSLGGLGAGSFSPSDYNFGMPSAPLDTSWLGQFSQGGLGAPGAMVPQAQPMPQQQPQGAGSGQGGFMGALPGLLGAGGGLAGILGQLIGGGQGQTQMPKMNANARTQMEQSNQALAPAAQGQLPLQQMQMSLLQALASGQGLPPAYQQLIEQAYQPQMGSLYEQAANQGRARGFHDAPAQSPPGGAILGPGLANLQGQMAQSKLGLMQSLPGMYQPAINSQIGAAGQQGQGLLNSARMGTGQTASQPIAPMIGQAIGAGMQGAGQAMQQGQQQQSMQDLINRITLSGQR